MPSRFAFSATSAIFRRPRPLSWSGAFFGNTAVVISFSCWTHWIVAYAPRRGDFGWRRELVHRSRNIRRAVPSFPQSMDLKSSRILYVKAVLLVVAGSLSVGLLLADRPALRTAALLAVAIWSFARAYYFAFY